MLHVATRFLAALALTVTVSAAAQDASAPAQVDAPQKPSNDQPPAVDAPASGSTDDPVNRYKSKVDAAVFLCELKVMEADLGGASITEAHACAEQAKADIKTHYQTAAATLTRDAAKDSLKDYHVAAVMALEAINRGIGESQYAHRARMKEHQDKLKEAWVRFDMER